MRIGQYVILLQVRLAHIPTFLHTVLFFGVFPSDLCSTGMGRSGRTKAAKIECAHRRACKLLTDPHFSLNLWLLCFIKGFQMKIPIIKWRVFWWEHKDKLCSHQPSHMHSTRHRTNSNFNTPLFNHSKTQKCYLHQVIPIWNSLPNS